MSQRTKYFYNVYYPKLIHCLTYSESNSQYAFFLQFNKLILDFKRYCKNTKNTPSTILYFLENKTHKNMGGFQN